MPKNKKLSRLVILISFICISYTNGQYQDREKNISIRKNYDYKIKDGNLIIKNSDSIVIYNSNILIKKEGLLDTYVYQGKNTHDFYLIYQNNASFTKVQQSFHFCILQERVFLINKEEIGFDGKKIYFYKNYITPTEIVGMDYQMMDKYTSINYNEKILMPKNRIKRDIYINKKKAFNQKFNYLPESLFIDYPIDIENISQMTVEDIETSNNIGYYLGKYGIHTEAIYILSNVIKKDKNRIVAHLNIADNYWIIGKKELAKKHYNDYVILMKGQNKKLYKVPNHVWKRIE